MTIDEVRKDLGKGPLENGMGGMTLSEYRATIGYDVTENRDDEEEVDEEDQVAAALAADIDRGAFKKKVPETLSAYQKQREQQMRVFERQLIPKISRLFKLERTRVAAELESLRGAAILQAKTITPDDEEPILIRIRRVLTGTANIWKNRLTVHFEGVLGRAGKRLNGGVLTFDSNVDLELYNRRAMQFVNEHVPKVTGDIQQTTLNRIRTAVKRGIKQGLSHVEVGREIQKAFTLMSVERSRLIAQTETGIAQSAGDFLAAKATGLDLVKVLVSQPR